MIACAVSDATDQEILQVCNRDNSSGTTNGWGIVVRDQEEYVKEHPNMAPVDCSEHEGRKHFIVLC